MGKIYLCILAFLLAVVLPGSSVAEPVARVAQDLRAPLATRSGFVLPQWHAAAGYHASFMAGDSVLFAADEFSWLRHDLAVAAGFGYGLDFRLDSARIRASNTLVFPQKLKAFGDTLMQLRYQVLDRAGFGISVAAGLQLYGGVQGRTGLGSGLSYLGALQASWQKAGWGVDVNAGWFQDWSRRALGRQPTRMEATVYDIGDTNRALVHVRGRYDWEWLTPYLAYEGQLAVGKLDSSRHGFVVGSIFHAGPWVDVQAASTFTLQPTWQPGQPQALPWKMTLGISTTLDVPDVIHRIRQLVEPEPVQVRLAVSDAMTEKAVPGRIYWYAAGGMVQARQDLVWNGFAREATYEVVLDDYLPVTGAIGMVGGRSYDIAVALNPVRGWLSGTLYNDASSGPTYVYVNNAAAPAFVGTGDFRLSFAPGQYRVHATAPGAVSAVLEFEAGLGQVVRAGKIHLVPEGELPKSLQRGRIGGGEEGPPDTEILYGPEGSSRNANAVLVFTSYAYNVSGYECRIGRGEFQACESPLEMNRLRDGRHSVAVRAVNWHGVRDPDPAVVKWKVDATAPKTSFQFAPSGASKVNIWSIWFEPSENPVAMTECSFDEEPFARCASPWTVSSEVVGEHVFRVRSTDLAGNVEDPPAEIQWTLVANYQSMEGNQLFENDSDEDLEGAGAIAQATEDDVDLDADDITIKRLEDGIVTGTFPSGSWRLSDQAKARLDRIAELIADNPNVRALVIEGSVDSIGAYDSNVLVARRRAMVAYRYLRNRGVKPNTMGIKIAIFVRSPGNLTRSELARERGVNIRAVFQRRREE